MSFEDDGRDATMPGRQYLITVYTEQVYAKAKRQMGSM